MRFVLKSCVILGLRLSNRHSCRYGAIAIDGILGDWHLLEGRSEGSNASHVVRPASAMMRRTM